ncbi:hypothetical protein BKA63DRAFT_570423 [Paraphoma chrysanthemicola]|nr:hypothetical protein BKA63DRAFT_570423 [Paraphoma chrysanthemicola]
MWFTFACLVTLVLAKPLRHTLETARSSRGSQPTLGSFNDSGFFQGSHSLEPEILRRADDTVEPPDSTVFYDVKDWQWDQDHANSVDKSRVKTAWTMSLDLIDKAISQLTSLESRTAAYENSPGMVFDQAGIPKDVGQRKLALRRFIAQVDPAYTQMFAADRSTIGLIHNNFKKVRNGITNKDAEGRNNNLIYLTAMKKNARQIKMKENAWGVEPWKLDACNGHNENDPPAQAFVAPINTMQWYVDMQAEPAKWDTPGAAPPPPKDALVINFCNDFFAARDLTAQLQRLRDGEPNQNICNLAELDTTERILIHEMTHPIFTLNTNSNPAIFDITGFVTVAKGSIEQSSAKSLQRAKQYQAARVANTISLTAESYAWYAIYSYMNNLDACAGVIWNANPLYTAGQCAADVWPPNVNKIVKNNWRCYVAGDHDKDGVEWCKPDPPKDAPEEPETT